ncbi:hypothetical protein BS78_06G040800 [Paspalum vaginatum]|nr:hypothetical protein BS78_06G040800 [Paspalum vaginatum]
MKSMPMSAHTVLVEEVLQAVVVGLDDEASPPEVRAPVPDRLDEADELALVGGERAVARCHKPTEESDRVALLDQDRAEAERGRVALDDEQLGEVRHGEDGGGRDGGLERCECRSRRVGPREPLLLEQGHQWSSDRPIVVDELAVVACEDEEAAHRSGRAWDWLVMDRLHLGRVHGHTHRGYDMAEVGDGGGAKRTLGALDEELVAA